MWDRVGLMLTKHLRPRLLLKLIIGASLGASALAGSVAALALFSTTPASQVTNTTAGSVGAGQTPAATVSGRDVSLSWGSATNAASYTIARTNVSPGTLSTTLGGTCSGSVAATSCSDPGLPENGSSATTWTYTDTPFDHLWQGPASSASSLVSIAGPTLSLGSTSFTADGGSTSATVANFFDSEGVTYCVDQSTSCSAGNTLGTDTVPATGGTKSTASITIPAALSVGSHTVYAIGSAGSLPSVGITIAPGAATQLVFTTQPTTNQNVTAGASTSFAVSVEDAHGNVETADTSTTVTVAIGTNPGSSSLTCTNTGGAGPVTVSSGVASFTCSLNRPGTGYHMTATSNPTHGTATSNAFNVVVGGVNKLVFSTMPAGNQTASATATIGAYQVQEQDSSGNPVTAGSTVAVTLSTTSAGTSGHTPFFSLTSGGASGTAVTSVNIASGQSTSGNFYYSDTKAGTPTLTAHNAGITNDGTTSTTIVAAGVNKLAFSTTPAGNQTASATATIGAYQVQEQDSFGNAVTAGSTVTVSLSTTSVGTSGHTPFFSLTSGGASGTAVTSVNIASGQSTSGSFYYSDTKAGTPTLTAHNAGITNDGTTSPTIVGAAAASLQLANCVVNGSGTSCTSPFSLGNNGHALVANVQALDQFGNPATISSAVNLSVTSNNTTDYSVTSGSTLTINGSATPPNQSTTTFTVQHNNNASNSATITVHVTSGQTIADLTFVVQK